MEYKDKAKAYMIAVEIGAITLDEIIDWADGIITFENEPSYEIIELACCKNKNDAVICLNEISKSCDLEKAFKFLFSIFLKSISSEICTHSIIAQKLFFMINEYVELEEYSEMHCFWDGIDLAQRQVYGDLNEEKDKLISFLQKNKTELKISTHVASGSR
ncbi:hypothetical protein ACWJJH_02965 [Endozoicomonadaceae bacterium StTr2]